MTLSARQSGPESEHNGPYRVMVVDDTAVNRGIIARYLEEEPTIKVVATASNGQFALQTLVNSGAEVIVLDIEMPIMDGMTALPQLIKLVPDIKIIMASTLTLKNADISLKAIEMGAADYVPKPESNRDVNTNVDFRRELVDKVRIYGEALRKKRGHALPGEGRSPASFQGRRAASYAAPAVRPSATPSHPLTTKPVPSPRNIVLRTPSRRRPEILAIGSSTGGPQALIKLLSSLPEAAKVPTLVVQHMPATFTAILADHISRATGRPAHEAVDGEPLVAGTTYVAPGNHHMIVDRRDGQFILRLNQDAQENFCRPAVDPMFRSVARYFGDSVLALVLTGMGHDGLKGGREIVLAGGTLLAQDEATSVVWGMPGAVATAGLCSAVLPLDDLPEKAGAFIKGVAA